MGDVERVGAHEDDVGGLHRHVRAGADRDADVGLRERGRVVDAVAHHRDAPALRLQLGDLGCLVARQHLGDHFVDPELAGDALAVCAAVAGEHHGADAERPGAAADGAAAVSRGASAMAITAAARPSIADVDDRAALARELIGGARRRPSSAIPSRSSSRRVADGQAVAADTGQRAVPGTASNESARGSASPRSRCGHDDRLRQRVLALALGAGDEPQDFVLIEAVAVTIAVTTSGSPRVSVPVLSKTTVSSEAGLLERRRACLKRIPRWAPSPVPTMIAVGVASPSASGQVMTTTVIANSSAS